MNYQFQFSKFFKFTNLISIIFFLSSILLVFFKGLNLGIDFKGGTLIEIKIIDKNIKISEVRSLFSNLNLGDVKVKEFGEKGIYLIQVEETLAKNKNLISEIKSNVESKINSEVNYRRIETVGPKVSDELLKSGMIAITLSLFAMLFYIWIRFEWQFSIGSIVALFHDVFITLGIFSLLSIEINLSIVAAVLTIIGYSMNDTVVIYDRIRENLTKYEKLSIIEIGNLSINETLSRTIITSITTLLALFSIFLLGGEILRGFSFAMILGVFIGTYSSIFIATPALKILKVSYKTMLKDDEKIVP
tara:strand:+ start:95 stop:1003 length:909 start_codon:yes stop_codon:yes gene_type:complete